MDEKRIVAFFKELHIPYHLYEHQPVFTVEEKPVVTAVDGVATQGAIIPPPHFKNLFLKDKTGLFFLVSVLEDKRVDLNALSRALGCARFSFGKPEELLERIKLTPGSVTPYGLIFDQDYKVTYVLDEDALKQEHVSFHPLRNDMTIAITLQDFLTCMGKMGHSPRMLPIPVK